MKILLLTIGIVICFSASTQTLGFWTMTPSYKIKFDSTINEYYIDRDYTQMYVDELTNTPGKELNLYVKHHNKGLILTLAGGLVMGGSAGLLSQSDSGLGTIGIVAGGLLALTGFVFTLEAPVHIKRAAIMLNATGVGIKFKL